MNPALKTIRCAFVVLALLAVLGRAVVPVGFMPVQGQGGKVEIVICTATGAASIFVDAHEAPTGGGSQNHHDAAPQDMCPYAPVLAQGLALPFFHLTAPLLTADDDASLPQATARPRAAVTAYRAQAPPFFS